MARHINIAGSIISVREFSRLVPYPLQCAVEDVERMLPAAKKHPALCQQIAEIISAAHLGRSCAEDIKKGRSGVHQARLAATELMKHLPSMRESAARLLKHYQCLPVSVPELALDEKKTAEIQKVYIHYYEQEVARLTTLIELLPAQFTIGRQRKGEGELFRWHDYASDLFDLYREITGSGGLQASSPALAFVAEALMFAGWRNASPKNGSDAISPEMVAAVLKDARREGWGK